MQPAVTGSETHGYWFKVGSGTWSPGASFLLWALGPGKDPQSALDQLCLEAHGTQYLLVPGLTSLLVVFLSGLT